MGLYPYHLYWTEDLPKGNIKGDQNGLAEYLFFFLYGQWFLFVFLIVNQDFRKLEWPYLLGRRTYQNTLHSCLKQEPYFRSVIFILYRTIWFHGRCFANKINIKQQVERPKQNFLWKSPWKILFVFEISFNIWNVSFYQ